MTRKQGGEEPLGGGELEGAPALGSLVFSWPALRQPEVLDKQPSVFPRIQPNRPWPGHAGWALVETDMTACH